MKVFFFRNVIIEVNLRDLVQTIGLVFPPTSKQVVEFVLTVNLECNGPINFGFR